MSSPPTNGGDGLRSPPKQALGPSAELEDEIRSTLLAAVLCAAAFSVVAEAAAETVAGDRIVVIDGDTVALPCAVPARGCAEKIRIEAIDAPETRNANCERELRAGLAAKERLVQLLRGGDVEVNRSGRLDRYGRSLGDLRTRHGDVGSILLRENLALRYESGPRAKERRMAHWCP